MTGVTKRVQNLDLDISAAGPDGNSPARHKSLDVMVSCDYDSNESINLQWNDIISTISMQIIDADTPENKLSYKQIF